MLSKAIKSNNKQVINVAKRLFSVTGDQPSILNKSLNFINRNTTAFQVAAHDPTLPLKDHKPLIGQDQQSQYEITSLANGFTVLTESSRFPSAVHMGFLVDVGTRDETLETSGCTLAIKNTYLKTMKHTNETINYGMIQMSGGDMQMDYDQERMYFKGHCIEYDTIDMFQMMVDLALEPKSLLSANVARGKNRKSHDLHNHLMKYDPFANSQELLLKTAYGMDTLGMPRLGTEKNIDNIDARLLQQFVMDNITPKKCLIVASGVQNHQEYVDLVKERLGDMLPVPEHKFERKAASYSGGQCLQWGETPMTSVSLAFESVPWKHDDVHAFYVMNTLLGSTAQGHGQQRTVSNMLQQHNFVEGASGINSHFTDSGLFGIQIEGEGSHAHDLVNVALEELNRLKEPIRPEELSRAKNVLKMNVLTAMERQGDRLEEIARNFSTFGELTFHTYCKQIDAVTSDQINAAAARVLAGKPTMVVTGAGINHVPDLTHVSRQLQ